MAVNVILIEGKIPIMIFLSPKHVRPGAKLVTKYPRFRLSPRLLRNDLCVRPLDVTLNRLASKLYERCGPHYYIPD